MELKDMTLSQLEEYIEEQKIKVCETKTPYRINEKIMIRTVTMIYTGLLVKIYPGELVLVKCCWIPETERWADTCAKGIFKEVEPYPPEKEVTVPRGGILDSFIPDWELPTKQK